MEKTFTDIISPIIKNAGKIILDAHDVEIAKVNVLANEAVAEKTYFDIILGITTDWALI